MNKQRIIGIDIIKALAAIFVVSIHQIGQTHVLALDMVGLRSFLILMYRFAVMSCVPMFIMATGYLQCRKTADKKFYKGIIPILTAYLLTTAVSTVVGFCIGDEPDAARIAVHTLNFTQIGYAWYVEMFIGLFLLIPFFNYMINSLTRKQQLILIFTLVFLTIFHSVPMIFSVGDFHIDVTPDYWDTFYPVTYYAVGAYIREYRPKIKKSLNLLLLFAAVLMPVIVIFIKGYGVTFETYYYVFNGFNSMSAFLIALLIFLLFYDIDISFKPARRLIISISSCTLELYLLSYAVERVAYKYIDAAFGVEFPLRLAVMIIVVFVCSYIPAVLIHGISSGFYKKFCVKKNNKLPKSI